ncbi:MAG: hypothetical protein Q8O57_03435, partial [Kiritimatiellota bacterium]|nr:hypothetical protein [Kiritimatiellota bacterium]
ALQKALNAAGALAAKAGARGRAIMALEPGTYNVTATLVVPEGVTLRGAGADMSHLRGIGYDPFGQKRGWVYSSEAPPVVQLVSRAGLQEVAVSGHAGKGKGNCTVTIQNAREMDEVVDASVRNCRIIGSDHPTVPSYGMYLRLAPGGGLRCNSFVRGLEIYDSEFKKCVINFGKRCSGARIVGNDVMGIGGRALINCYIARNYVHGGIKGFTTSVWPTSNFHNLWVLNKVYDVASGREGSDGEEFCIHGEGYLKFGRRAGPVTAATETTLTDSGAAWTDDQMKLNHVAIIGGRGAGQYRLIAGNTPTTLTVSRPWSVIPDATSSYLAAGTFVENTYLFNTTWSGSWVLFYKGQIGNVVQGHETDRSAGITLQANDSSEKDKPETATMLSLSWYNEFRDCLLDNSSVKFWLMCGTNNMRRVPNTLGNKVSGCIFRNSLPNENSFTGSRTMPIHTGLQGAISFTLFGNVCDNRKEMPKDPHTWIAYTFIEGNQFANTPVGIAIGEFTDRTFVVNNAFWGVDLPLIDLGSGTRFWDNKRQWFYADGRQYGPLAEQRSVRPATDAWQRIAAGADDSGAGRAPGGAKGNSAATDTAGQPANGTAYMGRIQTLDELVA